MNDDFISDVLRIAQRNANQFSDSFLDWLPDNEHIWHGFVREADKVRAMGFKHYSARTIVHVLRHHSALRELGNGGEWKINNDHSPYLARLYDLVFPDRAGLWEYRETKKVSKRQQLETTKEA